VELLFPRAESGKDDGTTTTDALGWKSIMSLIRPFAWLAALALVLGLAAAAQAQYYSPFIDVGTFEPDFQFFAPAEVDDFGGPEPPNTGVYFDYDRVYVDMNRPNGEPSLFSDTFGDFTWGNRYEIGYMTEEKTGWQAILYHVDGPNEQVLVFQERLDRINTGDTATAPDPIVQDRNPRVYFLRTSLNEAKFSSLELNKVWRRKEFHNGAVLEPVIGFRYLNFKDFYVRDNYTRFDADAAGEPVGPPPTTVDGRFEQLTTNGAVFTNNMVGGQLGFRLSQQRSHWLLSTDVRVFSAANFQLLENMTTVTLTRYTGVGGTVQLENRSRTQAFSHNNEFVWGGEVRAEASYELTRDITLRFGALFIDLGKGIGRGNTMATNSQDVQMAGITFGLTINR